MITFFGGKPRAGKTLRVVLVLLETLRFTRLPIVTNLALMLGPWVDGKGVARKGLLRTVQDEYGSTFDAERRIYILKPEEVRRFYAVRIRIPSNEWEPREVSVIPPAADQLFHFDGDKFGACAQFLDEAHEYWPGAAVGAGRDAFNARELLSWGSQQARIGDQAHFISQVLMNVDKKLRGVAQECHLMTNHRHLAAGPFRQPDVITYSVFASTPPGSGESSLKWGRVKFRRELVWGVYDTSSGVGVRGNTVADIGARAKGLHWSFILLAGAAVAFGGWLLLQGLTKGGNYVAQGILQQGTRVAKVVPGASSGSAAAAGVGVGPEVQRRTNVVQVTLTNDVRTASRARVSELVGREQSGVGVVGMASGTAGWAVTWSDGLVTRHKVVQDLGREVWVDGVIYPRGRMVERRR